jgi:hypothetical protein
MSPALCRSIFALFAFVPLLVLPAATVAGLSEGYGRLPLHFEANRGQVDPQVRFLARGPGYGLYLTASEAVLALGAKDRAVLRMALVGAAPDAQLSGLEELPGKTNYFIGKNSAQWRANVPIYAKAHYREVYPGADPEKILMRFEGTGKLEIDARGNLVLHTASGELRQHKPVVYQEIEGVRQDIDASYVIRGANRVGFQLAAYDTSVPLVIDPVLAYSTYLGGNAGADGRGIAVDASAAARSVFTASGLAPDVTHTLTIVVTGGGAATPGFLTGSAHVAVDAFDVTK